MPLVYTVTQLNRAVQGAITRLGAAGLVMVRGEIASVRVTSLGHGRSMVFFVLREGEECLSCVSFGRELARILRYDAATGEVFDRPRRIEDVIVPERRVVCEGLLGTYTKKGQSLYQMTVQGIADLGAGDAGRRLRELQERLARLGYFAEERKRPLPPNPTRVALVTSPTGAVIHDFLRTAQDRGLGARIRLYPARVQGDGAGAELAAAVRAAGSDGTSQVVVLIRGGGSEDDLACFNDEALARAIFECPVPVLAGIGHEVDFSIADATADVRASTPTRAAQLLWTPHREIAAHLDEVEAGLDRAMEHFLQKADEALARTEQLLRVLDPKSRWQEMADEMAGLAGRLAQAGRRLVDGRADAVDTLGQRAGTGLGHVIARNGQAVDALDERLHLAWRRFVQGREEEFLRVGESLARAGNRHVERHAGELETLALQLAAASPLAPLQRGFVLVQDEQGRVVRSVEQVTPGQDVRLYVADGSIGTRVTDVHPGEI